MAAAGRDPGHRFSGPVLAGVLPRQAPRVRACAAELAAVLHVPLVCAYADPSVFPVFDDAGAVRLAPIDPDGDDAGSEAQAAELAALLRGELEQTPVEWEFRRLWGEPAQALHRTAEELDASLIVLGTHQPGPGHHWEGLISGSVAGRLAHRQDRPVLLIP